MSFQYTTEYYTSPYYTVIVKLYDGFIPQKTQTGLEDPGTPSLPVVDQPQLGPATEIIRTYIDQNDTDIIDGINYLLSIGIIDSIRKNNILKLPDISN